MLIMSGRKWREIMKFCEAYEALKQGALIKCPEWAGYWKWENDSIKIHCKDGEIIDIRETIEVDYTIGFLFREDWEFVGPDVKDLDIQTFTFGEAIRRLKKGQRVSRKGWNGKGMSVVYQKGYPDGIHCNKQTAEAWGINEGDLFKCEPYLQISTVDGSHAMWVPSIRDCLAEDWVIVE